MTKIDIFSGFLGAGKTTLIKKLIDEAYTGEKLVLIENEFGEVGIDGGFLKDAGIEISELNSGCICCTLVGDFSKSMREVLSKFHPDRILIEPSGVGKLSDVMASVIELEKEEDVKLGALVTVVNALKAKKQMKAFGEFFNNQIEHATTVILSRSQDATIEQLEDVNEIIKQNNTKCAVITTPWESLSGEAIKKVMDGQDNLEMKTLAEMHHAKDHEEHEREHHHDHEHEHEHHHDHDHEHEHHHDHEHEHEHHHDHDHEHDHEHAHEHGHHHHNDLHGIAHLVRDHMGLPEAVQADVLAVYGLIAAAESKVHGVPVEQVHFHEVGALDAVADVTAVCLLLRELAPDQILASPVHVGSGQVRCAHGLMPVPAPATAELLK
ncbi:MAG: DUF111 family protein, partial [Lachnospiraceae bacterium]|nr:DUF111 family protein [Lachnospiraceae bacterium]